MEVLVPSRRSAVAEADAPTNPADSMQPYAEVAFDPTFEGLNLHGKIARISGYLGAIPKRGYNSFHKYNYVMEADLVAAVRGYLAAAGILMIPDTTSVVREGDLTAVQVRYTVSDGKESFAFSVPGYGADRGDKGVYKALTGSQKYAIMKLFKIETGDDPEQDTRVDERAAAGDSGPRAKPTVTQGDRTGVGRGAHTDTVSPVQLKRISNLVKTLDIERPMFAELVSEVARIDKIELPTDDEEASTVLTAILRGLSSEVGGQLIGRLEDIASDRAKSFDGDGGGYA